MIQGAQETRRRGLTEAALTRDTLHRRMLQVYRFGPRTDAEMARWLRVERTTINARRNELVKLGKVQDTGTTRKNPKSGVANALWGMCR